MSVFHLKYRPAKLADLDLAEVSKSLGHILSGKDVPQSFLFSGPKGAGKTSAARIVAKVVNCTNKKDGEPCDQCDNCKEIAKGSCIDVIEMDGASNRGIEDIRSLKDKVYLLPTKLAKKVFIIDEVHMLTKEAFNALLKLIEEPPKHTVFILCTTDEGKIPETVLSRLIKIRFYKGSKQELIKSLTRVIEGEKMKVDEAVIELVVNNSDGSFRNLQKTFNEMVMEYGGKISLEEAKAFFVARFGEYKPEEVEKDLAEGDTKKILIKMEKLAEKGVDFKSFRENLIIHFQNKLLGQYGVDGKGVSPMSAGELEKWLGLLIMAGKQEKDVPIDQLPLELAVTQFLASRETKENTGQGGIVRLKMDTNKKEDDIVRIESKPVKDNDINLNISLGTVEQSWGKVLQAVKPFNHSVEAFLRAARPKSVSGRTVILEVYYPFHKDKLEEQKNRVVVEKGLNIVFGAQLLFECVLSRGKKALVIKNDTPVEKVSEKLAEEKKLEESGDIYDVAKQIFG
jgi:DNA polymerase III subunit gamma/tau